MRGEKAKRQHSQKIIYPLIQTAKHWRAENVDTPAIAEEQRSASVVATEAAEEEAAAQCGL